MLGARVLARRCCLASRQVPVATTRSFPRALPSAAGRLPSPLHQSRLVSSDREDRLRRELARARPLVPDPAAAAAGLTGGPGRGGHGGRSPAVFAAACAVAAVVFYLANSQRVPVSGRLRFNFLSDTFIEVMGAAGAEVVVEEIQEQGGRFLPEWDPRFRQVKRVMDRLVPVSGLADLDWKIRVIDDNGTVNAFVTPGGNLFVFTGILRVCGNSDALAAVLGHEISHQVASHSAERMSAAWVANLTSGSLFLLAGALPGMALLGIWSVTGGRYLQDLLFNLPMSRTMETEADYIGLMMMSEACYDPREAVSYWRRMDRLQREGAGAVPEILSTHPSNDHRIDKMREWLPAALAKREESDCSGGTGTWVKEFRDTLQRRQLICI